MTPLEVFVGTTAAAVGGILLFILGVLASRPLVAREDRRIAEKEAEMVTDREARLAGLAERLRATH